MSLSRTFQYIRSLTLMAVAVVGLVGTSGCVESDVGAPCNHTSIDAPTSLVVTFPAITCNKLLCVYGESHEPAADECTKNSQCNKDGNVERFECVSTVGDDGKKKCKLKLDYVLRRSMCSQSCKTDDDCADAEYGDTTCEKGFKCTIIQSLGQLCCRKLCVCRDGLSDANSEEKMCQSSANMCENQEAAF